MEDACMKFGIIVSQRMVDRSAAEPFGRLYDYVREMEDLGYDLAWLGHHRFSRTTAFGGAEAGEPSAPLIVLSALLAQTQRMQMCTNIFLLPAYHPLQVAEELNTLSEISGGRFILGAGIGYKPDEFETVGWGFKSRAKRFEECLEILRLAQSGEPFSYHGAHFDISDCTVVPPPLGGRPTPVWIGAVSEPAMLRAARMGDGWLVSFAEHLVELQDKIARYKTTAAEHGRGATVCLMRDLHIAPTRAQLDPAWLPNVVEVWRSYAGLGAEADRDALSSEVMFGGKAVTLEEFTPNRAIVGDPGDCIRELGRIRDLIDPEYLLLTPTGVPDLERHKDELRLFAREVMPHFRT
jgi:alkanesulfonate monooxygenase SsuD/methylene tetrahydromethanopterin reductase-like flavin-dependent oxidoreductase (luciferase family)